MRKKVDERIRTLIENGAKKRHRSMFFIIGDKSRDQIINLHHMLLKAPSKSTDILSRRILWCYKKELELSSHKKKRAKQIKKLRQKGLLDLEKADSFSLFIESGDITYCLYKDSERILGNTFRMCILQDFEALTPNLLARTIETVEGGGLIILLLRSLTSLTKLYTMVMDVHERYRTESHSEATGRFNERFLLSIASCGACVVLDDELNILPISSHLRTITPVPNEEDVEGLSESERNLKNLQNQLNDDFPAGPLIRKCRTLDQGKAVITFLDAILDKTLRSTAALLAARGRGKSAALGLAVAGAIATGYSNIFVTAPSPENLKTLFEFICVGLKAIDYKEHLDYDVAKSANPEFKKATVRINVYKQHRQTIQYISPHEHGKLAQVELLIVDEAAAIPLPTVKSMLGPYLVFLSSTVNGYEGTGRSLSLKLLQQLEEQSNIPSTTLDSSLSGRSLKRIELSESIRYASGDKIESWLNDLLCLDVANSIPGINRLPPPGECDLYYLNRDTLFSYHKESELFLRRMMALLVASHYKNSPNDLQLMADAPAHHLFVLLGPVDESNNQLPDILCVLQISLEGQISHKSVLRNLSEGRLPPGDQIPWKFSEQFRDTTFPSLSGARIMRIATHPNAMRLGYGSVAVDILTRYYEGQIAPISDVDADADADADVEGDMDDTTPVKVIEAAEKVLLLEEHVKPRTQLPPLLVPLRERKPEKLHYISVSFGVTLDLFRFWRKHNFIPFYISQIPSLVTGEHACMVLKALRSEDIDADGSDERGYFSPFHEDFKKRFLWLLTSTFCQMEYKLAMSILDPKIAFTESDETSTSGGLLTLLKEILPPRFMERLDAYANNLVDIASIRDIDRGLGLLYFGGKIPVSLSYAQASVLLCLSLQHKDISTAQLEMKLERGQISFLFARVMKKFYKHLYALTSKEIESTLPQPKNVLLMPHNVSVDEDLEEAATQVREEMKDVKITGEENGMELGLENGKIPPGGFLSVKSYKTKENHCSKRSKDSNSKKKYKRRRRF